MAEDVPMKRKISKCQGLIKYLAWSYKVLTLQGVIRASQWTATRMSTSTLKENRAEIFQGKKEHVLKPFV
jgi:hypothetical protein